VYQHKNDDDVQNAISIELHRTQRYDGPHTWYDYEVVVKTSDFIPDIHNTEWKVQEKIIVGGDQ